MRGKPPRALDPEQGPLMPKYKAHRYPMTPLEIGLALSARRNGASVRTIYTALNKDRSTIQGLFRKHGYARRTCEGKTEESAQGEFRF